MAAVGLFDYNREENVHRPLKTLEGLEVVARLATLCLLLSLAPGCVARSPLVVAAVSCESRIREVDHNLSRIEHWARRAADRGADLVLFPECSIHAWWQSRENRRYAEPLDGPSIRRLSELAEELDLLLVVGLTELDGDRAYITQALVDESGVVGWHRKGSLAGGATGETLVWDEGDDARVFTVRGHRVGIAICYESVHPETCAALVENGATIILAPYANGTDPGEITDPERRKRRWIWERVEENRVWYVACDATPHDPEGNVRPGAAFVIDPHGRLVACTPVDGPGEGMVVVSIPPPER